MAYARVNLSMGRAEFMRITPRYFARLTKEHRDARERGERTMEYMLAQVISMVGNTGFKGWDEPRTPDMFMPSERKAKADGSPTRQRNQSRAQIAKEVRETMNFYRQHARRA
jgi:hypothetical protein